MSGNAGIGQGFTMETTTSPHDMRTRLSGGGEIPLVGLGTWQLRGDPARDAVGWALEAGYRHIDTATGYDNERAGGPGRSAASGVAARATSS